MGERIDTMEGILEKVVSSQLGRNTRISVIETRNEILFPRTSNIKRAPE